MLRAHVAVWAVRASIQPEGTLLKTQIVATKTAMYNKRYRVVSVVTAMIF
jgi:hypothetical protein